MKEGILKIIDEMLNEELRIISKFSSGVLNKSSIEVLTELKTKVSQMQLPVKPEIADDSNKIKWFMELAIKMYDTGYCDASIYSIDTDAWDEYRVNDKLTPSQAIAEEESNG